MQMRGIFAPFEGSTFSGQREARWMRLTALAMLRDDA
jgi:hypothetical protein